VTAKDMLKTVDWAYPLPSALADGYDADKFSGFSHM
jgi:hypothetical protein